MTTTATATAIVSDLLGALRCLEPAIKKIKSIPILSCVRIAAAEGATTATLMATDLNLYISAGMSVEAGSAIDVCVDYRLLVAYVESAGVIIEMSVEGKYLKLRSGDTNLSLTTMDTATFPGMPTADASPFASITGRSLLALLNASISFISAEESRFTLNGALWKFSEKGLLCHATDGYRLITYAAEAEVYESKDLLADKKAMTAAIRVIPPGASVDIAQDDTHLFLTTPAVKIACRKLTGKFPGFEEIASRAPEVSFSCDRDVLLDAAKRAALFADDRNGRADFSVSSEILKITTSRDDACIFEGSIKVFGSRSAEASLNIKYVIDALLALPFGECEVSLAGSKQCELRSGKVRAIIMPLRN